MTIVPVHPDSTPSTPICPLTPHCRNVSDFHCNCRALQSIHTRSLWLVQLSHTLINGNSEREGEWTYLSVYTSANHRVTIFLFRIFWLMYDSDCLAALSHRNTDLSVLTSLCVCHTTRWIQNALNRFDRRPMSLAVAFVGTPTIPEYFGYPSLKGVTGINIHVMFGSLCVFE